MSHVYNKISISAAQKVDQPSVLEALAYHHWSGNLVSFFLAIQLVHKAESKFKGGARTPAGDDLPIYHNPSLSIAARGGKG